MVGAERVCGEKYEPRKDFAIQPQKIVSNKNLLKYQSKRSKTDARVIGKCIIQLKNLTITFSGL